MRLRKIFEKRFGQLKKGCTFAPANKATKFIKKY